MFIYNIDLRPQHWDLSRDDSCVAHTWQNKIDAIEADGISLQKSTIIFPLLVDCKKKKLSDKRSCF